MLTRLVLKLNLPKRDIFISGDSLHGVIMETIDGAFAEELHCQGLKPFSQHLEFFQGEVFWVVNALTAEAETKIIGVLNNPSFSTFRLKKYNLDVSIIDKTKIQLEYKDLVNQFYFDASHRIFNVRFVTPTAFKSGGEYIFFPDWRLIIGSLMRKYNHVNGKENPEDSDILEALVCSIKPIKYELKSVYTTIERSKIPSFYGSITIKCSATQSLVNYLNLLLSFGEYSGVGIKCALGMGAISIKEKGKGFTNE